MPIYEYECARCGAVTEHLQHVDDPPPAKCPHCGARSKALARKVSRTSFVLKGGGWYRDLYGSAKPGGSAAESGGETDKKDKAEKKPEAKKGKKAKD